MCVKIKSLSFKLCQSAVSQTLHAQFVWLTALKVNVHSDIQQPGRSDAWASVFTDGLQEKIMCRDKLLYSETFSHTFSASGFLSTHIATGFLSWWEQQAAVGGKRAIKSTGCELEETSTSQSQCAFLMSFKKESSADPIYRQQNADPKRLDARVTHGVLLQKVSF